MNYSFILSHIMYTLIADSGSTKTEWALLNEQQMIRTVTTEGMNPFVIDDGAIQRILSEQLLPRLSELRPERVYFYGAGCKDFQIVRMQKLLTEALGAQEVEVASDMLGAARSVCGKQAGVVCIMGTGSNSCLYDGEKITANVSPLGYILGDEGSGASLGKLLVGEVLKGDLGYLRVQMFEALGVDEATLIERVYRKLLANRFLASLTPFLHDHLDDEKVRKVVVDEFVRFFHRNVRHYARPDLKVNFAGSIAWWFNNELHEAARQSGYQMGKVIQKPLEGLVEYHLS